MIPVQSRIVQRKAPQSDPTAQNPTLRCWLGYARKWGGKGVNPKQRSVIRSPSGWPLFALAYNLGNSLRRLALPESVKMWSLRTLREKLIKIGAKVVSNSRRSC